MCAGSRVSHERCRLEAGHNGLCEKGAASTNACTLHRRTMDVFEADCCVITNADKWPEFVIPPNWSAVVDAENDLVCLVPPHISQYPSAPWWTDQEQQIDSRVRAQIICDVLNAVQSEELR